MKTTPLRTLFSALLVATSLTLTPAWAGTGGGSREDAPERVGEATQSARDEARFQQPENYCLGGIEDRKVIVDESQITNPFRETSRLGCEVDGGDPHTMPDLPTPSPELRRLV